MAKYMNQFKSQALFAHSNMFGKNKIVTIKQKFLFCNTINGLFSTLLHKDSLNFLSFSKIIIQTRKKKKWFHHGTGIWKQWEGQQN